SKAYEMGRRPVDGNRSDPAQVHSAGCVDSPREVRADRIRIIRAQPVEAGLADIEILENEFPYGEVRPGFTVIDLDLGVAVEAVPALGRMEERVGIPDICPGKPDDPCQNAGARVGGKADNEVTDQIVTGLYVGESRKAVEPGQLVIDEPGDLDHVVRTRVGDKEVLRTQLN